MKVYYDLNLQNSYNGIDRNKSPDSIRHGKRYSELSTIRLIGELAFIAQPLVHLGSLAIFGKRSWKPWLVSLGLDIFRLVTAFLRIN